jgi:hypothetical protein
MDAPEWVGDLFRFLDGLGSIDREEKKKQRVM